MALIDLSSAFREPGHVVLIRLRAFSSDDQVLDALRLSLPEVARRVTAGDWTVRQAIENVRAVASALDPPSDLSYEFDRLDDSVALTDQTIFSEAELHRQFFEAVRQFACR